MRPGFGVRHHDLASLLSRATAASSQLAVWADGAMPLRIDSYLGAVDLPREIVTSVRCIVRVGDEIVICQNAHGYWHPWPGGRIESGESYIETACREVHEETGWLLEEATFSSLGWLHLEHQRPQADLVLLPYPDFLQVVFLASAADRDGGVDGEWTDTEGYEQRSRLSSIPDALPLVRLGDMPSEVFLQAILKNGT